MENNCLPLFDYWYDYIRNNGRFCIYGDCFCYEIIRGNKRFTSYPKATLSGGKRISIHDSDYSFIAIFRSEDFGSDDFKYVNLDLFFKEIIELSPYPNAKVIKK